jgi:hypothetical protein
MNINPTPINLCLPIGQGLNARKCWAKNVVCLNFPIGLRLSVHGNWTAMFSCEPLASKNEQKNSSSLKREKSSRAKKRGQKNEENGNEPEASWYKLMQRERARKRESKQERERERERERESDRESAREIYIERTRGERERKRERESARTRERERGERASYEKCNGAEQHWWWMYPK